MRKLFRLFVFLGTLSITLTGCKDPEFDQAMEEYCNCLNAYKGDPEGRYECIELIESMQEKYKNQPRKLNLIIERSAECF
jgi:hypothetical protein